MSALTLPTDPVTQEWKVRFVEASRRRRCGGSGGWVVSYGLLFVELLACHMFSL